MSYVNLRHKFVHFFKLFSENKFAIVKMQPKTIENMNFFVII
jgi:hypothetical protein